jgi:RNA polymerase sigma-70 factor (ECF subfamily)
MSRDPLANPAPLIRRVYAYVAYRIGDGADAEDVTSAAFERAFRYRSSFDGERGDVVSWLVGIARRCIVEHYANRLATTDDVPDAEAPGDLVEDAVRRLDVAPLVAALDRRDRELIALRYGADLSARQIAGVLGLRTNTVEVALHRVLARLRADLHRDEAAEAAAAAVRNAAATVVERTKFAKSDILGESAS